MDEYNKQLYFDTLKPHNKIWKRSTKKRIILSYKNQVSDECFRFQQELRF